MSYVVEELQILDSLSDSKRVSKFDKAFLDKIRSYAISVIQEKKLLEKRENLESVLYNVLELINDKIVELEIRAENEFDEFLVEKINLKIQELKVLRRRIILDNKVKLDSLVSEADTTKEGEKIIVDVLSTLSRNSQEMVTPEVVNCTTLDTLFRRIFSGINIGDAMDRVQAIDEEEKEIASELHQAINASKLVSLSVEHYNVVERLMDRIREKLSYENEIDDLKGKRQVTAKDLAKLEKRRWKFNSTKKKIRILSRRLDGLDGVLDQKEQLHKIAVEHVGNTVNTMRKIGLGDLALELTSLNLSFNPHTNEIESADLKSFKDGITMLGKDNTYDVALGLLEQVNRNYVRDEQSLEILKVMREAILSELSRIRGSLEVNRMKKYKIEDELVQRLTAYLHRIKVQDGKLIITEGELPKTSRTSFIAAFALKTIVDLRKDLIIEEVPEDYLISAEIQELEDWFREYTNNVYTQAITSIEDLVNDKDYSINL